MITAWFAWGVAHAQISEIAFASEHTSMALSPVVARQSGLAVELQAQMMSGFRAPTGFAILPAMPRLAVGWIGKRGALRWSSSVHGFFVVPIADSDEGGGGGISGGFSIGIPGARLRAGFEADIQALGFRSFDDIHTDLTAGLDLTASYELGPVTVMYRLGTLGGWSHADTTRRGVLESTFFEPRMALGGAWALSKRWSASALVRAGVRASAPRVPWSVIFAGTWLISAPKE